MTGAAEAILRSAVSDAAKGKGVYPEVYRVDVQDVRGEPSYTIHGTATRGGIKYHWVGYIAKWRLSDLVLTEQWANNLVERIIDVGG